MRVHPFVYFVFHGFIRLLLVLIFIGIPTAVYFLRTHGIGFGAREALEQALSSDFVEVDIRRLALDPFAGLVANDVVVHEKNPPMRELASINRISISLNMSELMRRKIVVDTLSLDQADATIPTGSEDDDPRINVRDITSEIIILGDRLRLSIFKGVIEGIRFQLTGEIINPLDFKAKENDANADTSSRNKLIKQITTALKSTDFPDGKPVINATFEMDAANPESLSIPKFTISSGRVQHGKLAISSINAQGEYNNGQLRVPIFRINDNGGNLQASMEWNRYTNQAQLSLVSSLDLQPYLQALAPSKSAINKLSFPTPPQLNADVSADLSGAKPSVRVIGSFLAPQLSFAGTPFHDAGLSFAWQDGKFHARDIAINAKRGFLKGNLWIAPEDYRIDAHLTIPPTDLASMFDPKTKEFLDRMEFEDLPDVRLSIKMPKLDFAAMRGTGHLKIGRTAMRGAWIDSWDSPFEITDRCVTFKNLVIKTGAGKGTGSFAYDVGRQEVRLENVRSTLVPVDVMMWIDPRIAETIRPYRFRSAPTVDVQGKVHMKDPLKNNLAIRIEAPGGLDYDLLKKTLSFGPTSAKVDVVSNKVTANVTRSTLMGGDVGVKAVVSIDPKNPVFSADVILNRVNFSRLTKLYFDYDDSKGVISGRYSFNAQMGNEELMTGKGSLRIEDGNVFAIPFLGPFSLILGNIIPGVFYNTARLATADFTVGNKKINTRNIEIIGTGFTMFGDGDIYFLTGDLDMSMRINAQGIPGIVFFPMSKLFEYHSNGTISNPRWSPKIIPRFPGQKKRQSP
jgi:hypothetical protein